MSLTDLQKEQLQRIVTVLTNMGVSYKLKTPDGEVLTNTVEKSKSKRAPNKFPHGEVRNYIRPYVENLRAGEAAYIPFDKYPPNSLQSNTASMLSNKWGSKTFGTTIHRDKGYLEVLRTDGI